MLYSEYIDEVKKIALIIDDDNEMTYIWPDYEYALRKMDLGIDKVSDYEGLTYETVYRNLVLERDMRNAKKDKLPIIIDWLYNVVTTVVEPAVVEEQNKLIKDVIEYRKERNAIDDRTKELDMQEKVLEEKSKIIPMNFGLNFSKKKP